MTLHAGAKIAGKVGARVFSATVHDISNITLMIDQVRQLKLTQSLFVERPRDMGVSVFRSAIRGAVPSGFQTRQDAKRDGMWIKRNLNG